MVSMLKAMRTLLATEFTALLDRAGLSQAAFGRLTGVTARQVNNWARGRGRAFKIVGCWSGRVRFRAHGTRVGWCRSWYGG